MHLSIDQTTHLLPCSPTCLFTHPSAYVFIHPPTHPFIFSLTHLFTHSPVYASAHRPTQPPIHLLIHPPTHLSPPTHPPMRPVSTHPFIHLSHPPRSGLCWPVCAACGRTLVAETGVLTSPDYPSNYPHNRNCTWTITVPANHQISLNFTTFRLESHYRCQYDYLEIR